jgi:hypothetical protein
MTAAVHKPDHPEEFTRRYAALLHHYGLEGKKIQTGRPNENGDVEQSHHRFKRALDQALMLRGSREFATRGDYGLFVRELFCQLNSGRRERLVEELQVLRRLPAGRIEACRRLEVSVTAGSTIRVANNTYSVDSRLIGERVQVRLFAEWLEVWYAQRCVDRVGRLRGEGKHRIQYRHVIDTLVRKPGAFENYRYREDLFPTIRFRMAYDHLKARRTATQAARQYLAILELAAKENEAAVDQALADLFERAEAIVIEAIRACTALGLKPCRAPEPQVVPVDLAAYDQALLSAAEVA